MPDQNRGNDRTIAAPDQEVALERKAVDAMFCAAPFTALFAEKKLAQIIGSAPVGIAGTGIFFGPTLLDNVPAATAVLNAFRKGAADVAGGGYYKPENLAAMAKYTGQPVDLIKTTEPENIELEEKDLDRVSGGAFDAYLKIDGEPPPPPKP